jgi:para-nitrobenzyl esterase
MNNSEKAVVETRDGKVQGSLQKNLYIFRGVPYAAPPVGEYRWLPPRPVNPWKGIRPALTFGAICPQSKTPAQFNRLPEVEEPQSEYCLFLNVWTPGLDNGRRPVMVWIHGGAFKGGSGSSPTHDGSTLAHRGNVVIVTINYRLGPLGFLHLDKITGGRIPATGNEGLLDQIAALRWVRQNIASFGGDPDNVTVFGESAGAMSIGCLLAMPLAQGLFRKAILESGSNTCKPVEEAVSLTEQFLGFLGVSAGTMAELRTIPAELLLAAFQKLSMKLNIKGSVLEPVVDGSILPAFPIEAVKKGSAAGVAIMVGTNLDESRFMAMLDRGLTKIDEAALLKRWQNIVPADLAPSLIAACRKALEKSGSAVTTADVSLALQTDVQFRIPAFRLLQAHWLNHNPAYGYLFTWPSPQAELGSCHALEVGFVFGILSPSFNGSGPKAEKLAASMQDAWIAFARNGKPDCDSLGVWPQYGERRDIMLLGENCHVEPAPLEEERRAWEAIPDKFLG